MPGRRNSGTLKFDEAKSKALNADDVYKTHQKQQADGTLQTLSAFNRKEETARQGKADWRDQAIRSASAAATSCP